MLVEMRDGRPGLQTAVCLDCGGEGFVAEQEAYCGVVAVTVLKLDLGGDVAEQVHIDVQAQPITDFPRRPSKPSPGT